MRLRLIVKKKKKEMIKEKINKKYEYDFNSRDLTKEEEEEEDEALIPPCSVEDILLLFFFYVHHSS